MLLHETEHGNQYNTNSITYLHYTTINRTTRTTRINTIIIPRPYNNIHSGFRALEQETFRAIIRQLYIILYPICPVSLVGLE